MQLLFLQDWFSGETVRAIGWTFIHSLWQGLLAAVLAGIIIMVTKRAPAGIRYNLLVTLLVFFIVATAITFSQQLKTSAAIETPIVNPVIQVAGNSFFSDNYQAMPVVSKTSLEKFVDYFNTNADLFVLVWAVFFFFHCIKLLTGLAGVNRLRSYKTYSTGKEWQEKMTGLSNKLGIRRSVVLLESKLVKMPVAIGYLKPVIFVPFGLLSNLPPEQVETILLHELAHVRRNDYLVNIIQRLTEAVYFFNPAYLWISSMIRHEREACCDDIVLANSHHKQSYLEALVSFQEYSFANSGYMMAISGKRNYLLNRVRRMITQENKKLDIMEKIFLVAGVIAMTAFTFIPKKEKEVADKKPLVVVQPVTETVAQKPVQNAPLSTVSQKRRPSAKKETGEAIVEVTVQVPRKDTVPKEKTNYSDLKFPSISSTVNDDGKTRTENTTVTDQDGKKYIYTKLNDKITSLTVDGKSVPENEFGNYSDLFQKIEATRQENKERKLKSIQERREAMDKRNEEQRERRTEEKVQRVKEQREKIAEDKAQRDKEQRNVQTERKAQRDKEQREVQAERKAQKDNERKLTQLLVEQKKQTREFEKSRTDLENKRKTLLRQFQNANRQNKQVPTINGREVIKNENSNNKYNSNADVKIANSVELYYQPDKTMNLKSDKAMNLKIEPAKLKFSNDLTFKTETKLDPKKDGLQNIQYETGINIDGKSFLYDKERSKNPDAPVKEPAAAKPSKKNIFSVPKRAPLFRKKGVTT